MPLSITAFYAALGGLWLTVLAVAVIRLRRARRVSLHDGGHDDLAHAVRAHANAAETLPVALVLLAAAESLGLAPLLLHALGALLIAGRVVHAGFFLRADRAMRLRVAGMAMTLAAILALALSCLVLSLREFAA